MGVAQSPGCSTPRSPLGIPVARWAALADSVTFCFAKGLGAPAGAMVVGDAQTVERARHVRKRLGGAMRQTGVLAAAGKVGDGGPSCGPGSDRADRAACAPKLTLAPASAVRGPPSPSAGRCRVLRRRRRCRLPAHAVRGNDLPPPSSGCGMPLSA
ncbi:beta-eliminating lyase-related protein [Streptomyces sp. NPDC001698]|uniref:beta-eliminating lyase-related protein n=1 Tax=unclassified Streptomyces TaxID=2593676 RepID=UPI003685A908